MLNKIIAKNETCPILTPQKLHELVEQRSAAVYEEYTYVPPVVTSKKVLEKMAKAQVNFYLLDLLLDYYRNPRITTAVFEQWFANQDIIKQ